MKILGIYDSKNKEYRSLSSKYDIKIEKNEVMIFRNIEYIENFYNVNTYNNENEKLIIEDVHIFIGENGTGKTFLLNKTMFDIRSDYAGTSIIYEQIIDNEVNIFVTNTRNFHDKKIILDGTKINFIEKNLEAFNIIFYSSAIEYSEIKDKVNLNKRRKNVLYHDFSNTNQLKKLTTNNSFKSLIDEDILNQITFILQNVENNIFRNQMELFQLLPKEIVIKTYDNVSKISNTYTLNKSPFNKKVDEFSKILFNKKKYYDKSYKFIYNLNKQFLNHIYYIFKEKQENLDVKLEIVELENLLNYIKTNKKSENNNKMTKIFIKNIKEYENFNDNIFGIDVLKNINEFTKEIEIKQLVKSEKSDLKRLMNFISSLKNYDKFDLQKTLDIKWKSISSGQNVFLNLFGRMSSINLDSSNALLVVDEVDLGLHPQWQKDWLFIIIEVLNIVYTSTIFQLILTSHSPIVLSNFRKADVTTIGKEFENYNEFNSFAGNINLLLSQQFDMTDGLVGEFSKRVTKKIIHDMEKNKDIIQSKLIINEIGEPILKTKLEKIYQQKMYFRDEKNENLLEIKKEIDGFRELLIRGKKNEKN